MALSNCTYHNTRSNRQAEAEANYSIDGGVLDIIGFGVLFRQPPLLATDNNDFGPSRAGQ